MIEEIKAYKFDGEVFETKEEAEKAENMKRLAELVEEIYYNGINENGIIDGIVGHKKELLSVLQKIQ